jgi:hypothetical protein
LLSEHYFITPVDLHIRDRQLIKSGDLTLLADLPDLEELSFGRMRMGRRDLASLPPLARLRTFRIEPSYLASEMGLQDFSFLRGFPRLQELSLGFSRFGDDDVRLIADKVDLCSLNLGYTTLGDDGLSQMQGLTKLERLGLARTKVTDDGMRYLRSFPRLEMLDLHATEVSDKGLQHLHHLQALRQLNLMKARVSEAGVAKLRKALSKCRIRFEHSW